MQYLTTADIAAKTGKPQTSIARRARLTGIGRRAGRDYVFSAAEAEKLIKALRPQSGNPNFVRKTA